MKKKPLRHKAKKKFHRSAALLMCMLLAVSCYSAPVLGAETDDSENITAVQEDIGGEEITDEGETEDDILEEDAEDILNSIEENNAENDSETYGDTQTVTVTFQMGVYGSETVEVMPGNYPRTAPAIPQLPAANVLGWYDSKGNAVSPEYTRVFEDTVYTARWSRKISDIFNTEDHTAYINGYDNGMFKPEKGVTRAEAAKMMYSLLKVTGVEVKTFSDTENKWFTEAVGTMAGLGVFKGYDDGTFKPQREITRAEFVKMVVGCDTITSVSPAFSDVDDDNWAAPYIATATEKGWINGFADGTFKPDKKITRAQAVTIINNMLGRSADDEVVSSGNAKDFYDVYTSHWAYADILEAATTHKYNKTDSGEKWTEYTADENKPTQSCWVKDGNDRYYLDAKTGKFLRGEQTIDGKKYLFDSTTGAAYTGFRTVGKWKRYYKNGLQMEDISNLGLVSGPYFIKVYKNSNYLIVYAKDDSGSYNIPVKAMRVSCGYGTPVGTYYTPYRYRWLRMEGYTWAQWCTQIYGNYLFHSVPNWTQSNMDLEVEEFNYLGETRSMGCIRLNCEDAKWIYDNCVLGTRVTITINEDSGPLLKPDGIKIPSWHTWDPTDPTAKWLCEKKGCH